MCLTNYHLLDSVANTLLEYGLQVLQLRGVAEEETESLIRNLISLKGPYLNKHVKALAQWYLKQDNPAQAEALVKSKLKGNEMKQLLVELGLVSDEDLGSQFTPVVVD